MKQELNKSTPEHNGSIRNLIPYALAALAITYALAVNQPSQSKYVLYEEALGPVPSPTLAQQAIHTKSVR